MYNHQPDSRARQLIYFVVVHTVIFPVLVKCRVSQQMLSLVFYQIKATKGSVSIKTHCYLLYLIINLCTVISLHVSWLIALSKFCKEELEETNEE